MACYHFVEVANCPMCSAPVSSSKIVGLRLNQSQGLRPRSKSGVAVTVRRCNACDLVFSSPEPRPRHIDDHYDIAPDEYWNDAQMNAVIDSNSRPILKAKELMNFTPGMKALDIGTGIGRGFRALQEAGFDTWGIEPSPSFRAKALELTGACESRITLASIEDVAFSEGMFDFITLGAVFEHLYNPAKQLERSIKLLRPGGIWYAEVPSSNWLIGRFINAYFRLIGTNFVTNLSPMHSPFHIHEFTHRSFQIFAQKTKSFDLCAYEYEVCSVREVPRMAHPLLRRIMTRTNTGMQLHVWLQRPNI